MGGPIAARELPDFDHGRVRDAREDERRSIARELHDSVGGQLTGVEIAGALLHRKLARDGSPHAEEARELLEHLAELHRCLRAVSRGLRPVEDDPLGLMAALRRLARAAHGRNGSHCRFRCDGDVAVPDNGVATNLFHIAEEAVQNSVRHARARQIVINLRRNENDNVVLEVWDDGVGIPDEPGAGGGIGMDSMTERAALIGGSLKIRKIKPSGTLVRVAVADVGIRNARQ